MLVLLMCVSEDNVRTVDRSLLTMIVVRITSKHAALMYY